jgi:hypothetical protein
MEQVMTFKPLIAYATALAFLSATLPIAPAFAGGGGYSGGGSSYGGMGHGPACKNIGGGGNIYKPTFINKNINVYKPTNINKNINVFKPVNINKNININNNININKNINQVKNININKDVNINKNVVNNKNIVIVKTGGGTAEAAALAIAAASANANSNSSSVSYSGSYSESTVINQGGGFVGGAVAVDTQQACHMVEASVVKAIHAVCMFEGREFGASHMTRDTWIESSYEGEVARCIPGASLKVVIGDMVQSDQGMAGSYEGGQTLNCAPGEALRHFKDGMLKCAVAVPVKDCTERTNLRLFGTGDFFFSYRTQVCATSSRTSQQYSREDDAQVSGMALDGGVGAASSY